MPCYDSRLDESAESIRAEVAEDMKRLRMVEAILCGILTTLSDHTQFTAADGGDYLPDFLERLDYKEMGVTRQDVFDWWTRHQEQDRTRRSLDLPHIPEE